MLRSVIAAATMAVTLAASLGAATAATAQQERMKTCNADAAAKSLKGDERKAFMSTCLSDKAAAQPTKPVTAQQEKMKKCNAEAAGKTGEDRKAFMSSCLKG
ncbi:PsiF family protein [Azospirillum sp. TSO5]|uniref:PsiF family protein n=1 Tax=Azospirillum sp. TSO5 TaxID=716760 RepID=UPI0018EEA6DD|nr:PsiF family protein [Azospirillum sp. TSO5]